MLNLCSNNKNDNDYRCYQLISIFSFVLYFSVLADGLKENFSNVAVQVLDCPDLRQAPFHLAAEGSTNPRSFSYTCTTTAGFIQVREMSGKFIFFSRSGNYQGIL